MAKPVVNMPIYKQFAPVRTALYVAFAAVFLLFPVGLRAETNPAYTVEGVEVDVVAENAVKAREKALDEAQAKAYEMLAERFLSEDQMKTFRAPDPVTLSTLVQDFEVTKEQLSTRRYKGTFTFRFRPNAMKMQMASQGKIYSDRMQKPVLVLPFYDVAGKTVLWGEDNPFMTAWRALPEDKNVLQPLAVPLGDADDIADVTGDEALDYDPMRVQELASRYGADDVAILLADSEPSTTMEGRVTVNIYTNGFEGPKFVQKVKVNQLQGEDEPALFARAAQKVRDVLRTEWKTNAAYNPMATAVPATQAAQAAQTAQAAPVPYTRPALGPTTGYTAHARFSSVQDWVRMKNTLDKIYGMQAVMIKTMKPQEALLDMRFAGDVRALQLALQNAGITLRGGAAGTPYELYMGQMPSGTVYR